MSKWNLNTPDREDALYDSLFKKGFLKRQLFDYATYRIYSLADNLESLDLDSLSDEESQVVFEFRDMKKRMSMREMLKWCNEMDRLEEGNE